MIQLGFSANRGEWNDPIHSQESSNSPIPHFSSPVSGLNPPIPPRFLDLLLVISPMVLYRFILQTGGAGRWTRVEERLGPEPWFLGSNPCEVAVFWDSDSDGLKMVGY